VSFYFDGRIQRAPYSPDLLPRVEHLISKDVDIVVGVLALDHVSIDVDFLSSPEEVAERLSNLDCMSTIFFGFFPARNNDGVTAVTIDLPDSDGVVRPHPH